MSKKLTVGQTVFVKSGKDGTVKEAQVAYVGRKYFKLSGALYKQYDISTMYLDDPYWGRDKAYISLQEIEDEKEQAKLAHAFAICPWRSFPLETLRKIKAIIDSKD